MSNVNFKKIMISINVNASKKCLFNLSLCLNDYHTNTTDNKTAPPSTVGNISCTRCESDCRSRSRSLIPARSHTFVEIDHEIISTIILLPSAESFKKGCCQLQANVCVQSTG